MQRTGSQSPQEPIHPGANLPRSQSTQEPIYPGANLPRSQSTQEPIYLPEKGTRPTNKERVLSQVTAEERNPAN